jgi:putative DNA-invertase from lambdoid prophage Rac
MVSRTRRSQPDTTDTVDVDSLPLPMRRAYLRCREADGPHYRPKGEGAHIYARVSSDEQAGVGKTSLDEQIRLCEKLLVGTSIPIIGKWRDEGFSGVSRLSERPIGRELVDAVEPGQIVVTYRLDRFSRNALLGLADINELRERGVGLFIAGDQRWIPPAGSGELDPISEFNLQQGIITAQLERGLVVERTQAGKRALILRGYWPYSVAPYGFRREHDGIGWKLVPDENEQKVLALIRRCHHRGASVPQITAALNAAEHCNRRGKKFEYSAVYAIMRYHGIIQLGTKSGGAAKSTKAKPNGNPTIAVASSAGVSAVVERKLRDAERVAPIIAYLISQRGCTSYRQLADALNYLAVETPRGGRWHPSSVKNVMAAARLSFGSLHTSAAIRDRNLEIETLPQRPTRTERQAVRRRYGLPATPRGRVQKAAADILFLRDGGMAADDIARMLGLGRNGVRAIVQRYPRWDIEDPAVIEQVLARYAAGDDSRKIARTLGLDLKQVRRLTQIQQRLVKPPRKRVPPLAEDRKAAILALRRQGKTGPEIFAEIEVDTEQERVQIRRFLLRRARGEPALALGHSPVLTDEIAAAKREAKPPADYVRRDDYYLQQYWDDRWKSPLPPEVVRAIELLEQGKPIVEVVDRAGLPRGRVKYIRAALQAGRCGLKARCGSGS